MIIQRIAVLCALVAPALAAPALSAHGQEAVRDTVPPVPARGALSALLASASRKNALPPNLIGYSARVESEISVLARREEGMEGVVLVEQVASTLTWNRAGFYDQHIVGYRAQQTNATLSMLSLFETGWLNPTLYGNRLRVRTRRSNSPASRRRGSTRSDGADTLPAVHPLSADRERYYRYSGGDTVVTLRTAERVISIARVRVQPRGDVQGKIVLFDGEMDLDASTGVLVRLRGYYVRSNVGRNPLVAAISETVAFVEYENAERVGEFWLPARQRIELQATLPFLGEARAVIRIVSRFADMRVNETSLDAATLAAADSLRARSRRTLTYATGDSLDRFSTWNAAFGGLSQDMHADDFNDIGPDRWRTTGTPRFDFGTLRASDAFHYNRVEGVFTGVGGKLSFRDVAPGVVARVTAGWAWGESTVRGRASVARTRQGLTLEARAGRSLDNTNDFRVPFDSGNTPTALFGSVDPYDYVDRNSATLAAARSIRNRALLVRAEVGVADDRFRVATQERSPFGGTAFRDNRGIDAGGYVRTAALLEWHPDFSAEFAEPGVGARVAYERGDGTLNWQRAELRVTARRPIGPFLAIARGDVGEVFGARIPPQQLFELGRFQNLPGFADKEFAGSRAAVLRAQLQYTSAFFRRPIRFRQYVLPALAPGLSVGVQSGWAEAPTQAARQSIDRLGVLEPAVRASRPPVSRPTDGIRASVTAGLRFFSGGVFVGATRAVDQAAPWRTLIALGQQW